MAKAKKKLANAKPSPSSPRTAGRGGIVLGALVLLAALTSVVPAFAQGEAGRTRSVAVLLVAVGWLVCWAVGYVRFSRQQWLWLAGLGATTVALVASSVFARFPLAELLGGLGTGMGAVQWFALVVIAAGVSSVTLGRVTRLWVSLAVAIVVVPVAVVGLVQAASGQAVSAGLVNHDLFGLVLVAWLAPAFGLAITSRAPWERWAWVAVGGLAAVAVVASGARAASAGVVLEVGLLLALVAPVVAPSAARLLRVAGYALAAVAALAIAVVVAAAASSVKLTAALVRVFGVTLQTRSYLYQTALRAFARAPLLGTGPDGYQRASQGFVQPQLMAVEHGHAIVDVTPSDPHSIGLRLLVGLGIVGLIALGFAIAGWVLAIARTKAPSPQAAALRDSFAIGVAGFVLASLTSPWPLTIGAGPVVVAGLAAAGFGASERLPDVSRIARWVVSAVLSAVLLFVAWAGVRQAVEFHAAVRATSQPERLALLVRARSAMPWSSDARFQALWMQGNEIEAGVGDVAAFHRAIDADPLVTSYAPLTAELVRQSVANARLTGRRDLAWERARLASAAALAPDVPEVAAERLHLALVSGDKAAIASALDAANGIAEPAEQYAAYASQARQVLGR